MFVTTSGISVAWLWCLCTVWTAAGAYICFKSDWFEIPDRHKSFPFGGRLFFLMGLSLICVAGLYIASFLIAHNVTDALKQLPLSASCDLINDRQSAGLLQIVGIILAALGLWFFSSLLPNDLKTLVVGSSGGFKKLFRGFMAGVLVYPIVTLVSIAVGALAGAIFPISKPPQIALEVLQSLVSCKGLFVCAVIILTTFVPYVEEILFRGYLQAFFLGTLHPAVAIFLSSVAFSALHYAPAQKGSNFEIVAGLLVFSIFSSRIRIKEDSIFSSIGMHMAFNTTSIILYTAQL